MMTWTTPKIEERKLNQYHWLVLHKENLQLGRDTDMGAFTLLDASEGIIIEDGVKIGSHCAIYSRTDIDQKKGTVTIKRNTGIGSHCVVMPGVTIGENSVVGAGAVITRDVPPNVIVAGNPAKVVRQL